MRAPIPCDMHSRLCAQQPSTAGGVSGLERIHELVRRLKGAVKTFAAPLAVKYKYVYRGRQQQALNSAHTAEGV